MYLLRILQENRLFMVVVVVVALMASGDFKINKELVVVVEVGI